MNAHLKDHKGLFAFEGIVLLAFGLAAITLPRIFTLGLEIMIGVLLLVVGVLKLTRSFRLRGYAGFWPSLLSALAFTAVGVLLLSFPAGGVLSLTLLLAILFLWKGIWEIALGISCRTALPCGWPIASGVISFVLGVLIFVGWPSTAAWAIGLLFGINLLVTGTWLLAAALVPTTSDEELEQPLSS